MEPRYTVRESYPSGHEMNYDSYGPGTRQELESLLASPIGLYADEDWPLQERLDTLFGEGVVHCEGGYTYELNPILDIVLVIQWDEPEEGLAVYGPYATEQEARNAWPKVMGDFLNEGVLPSDVRWETRQIQATP